MVYNDQLVWWVSQQQFLYALQVISILAEQAPTYLTVLINSNYNHYASL